MKLQVCKKCGQLFEPKGKEKVCPFCFGPRRARVNGCIIEEAEGRCKEFLRGECVDCLMFCAIEDWIGWRKIDER